MFLLAVKLAIAISGSDFQAARIPNKELGVWNQIRPGIVTLYSNGHPSGVAALIDDAGYFVAHSSSTTALPLTGMTNSGKQLAFTQVSQDKATMLVLLKADAWEPGTARPFHAPTEGEEETGQLIAVLPSGPMRMSYGSRHKLGVLNPSRRLVPLTEMRFEAAPQIVGGALIFSDSGDLIGSLNATLGKPDDSNQRGQNFNGGGQGGGGFANDRPNIAQKAGPFGSGLSNQGGFAQGPPQQYSNSGPSAMTVAYSVSSSFVRHVLEGFLSHNHSVEFAILGVFCTDALGGGAQIQQITAGSPADKGGLRPGDVIVNINSSPIGDQLAFASVMLQQKVGKKIPILVQRGERKLLVDIAPGKAAD